MLDLFLDVSNLGVPSLQGYTGGNLGSTSDYAANTYASYTLYPSTTLNSGSLAPASSPNTPVPEPDSLALLTSGLAGLMLFGWWKRKNITA